MNWGKSEELAKGEVNTVVSSFSKLNGVTYSLFKYVNKYIDLQDQ